MFAAGAQLAVALTPPYQGRPPNVLDDFGRLFQAPLSMATDLGRIASGPGACEKSSTAMGSARFGDRPVSAALPPGRC